MANKSKASPLDVMESIEDFTDTNGYPPTYRELAEDLGLCLSTVYSSIGRLEGKGLVERRARISRGLSVTEAGLCMLKREGRLRWK